MRKTILFLSFFVTIIALMSIICMLAYAADYPQYCSDTTAPSDLPFIKSIYCNTTNTYTNMRYSPSDKKIQADIMSETSLVPCSAYIEWFVGEKDKWYQTYNYTTKTVYDSNYPQSDNRLQIAIDITSDARFFNDKGKYIETTAINNDNDVCKHRITTGTSIE